MFSRFAPKVGFAILNCEHHQITQWHLKEIAMGIEIYADKPRSKWKYNPEGKIIMVTEYLDIKELLEELK